MAMKPIAFQDLDLRELAQMEANERAFVSCYLSPADNLSWFDHRANTVAHMLEDEPEAAEHFAEGLRLIREWLEEHKPEGKAVCIFACYALDYVRGALLPIEVENNLSLGPAPLIRPLAELQDEYENFVLIAADNDAAEIHFVSSAAVRMTEAIKGDIKNHVKKGGWSQKRYQRRRKNELLHYAKEVAEQLEDLAKQNTFGRIVLLGSLEARGAILEALPEQLSAKVVADTGADLNQEENELLEQAYKHYFEAEREDERSLWLKIKESYFADGLAVAGAGDVWQALESGRVDAMAINRDLELDGSKCGGCGKVFWRSMQRCKACKSDDVFEINLLDEMVRQAERTSAFVDFVDPIPGLEKIGGVAALLRW